MRLLKADEWGMSVEDDQIDEDTFFGDTPDGKAKKAEVLAIEAAKKQKISPRGAFGPLMPPLLDRRRHAYSITDGHFKVALAFDRIFVKQIPEFMSGKFGDGVLYQPDISKDKDRDETPLGILVGAGLLALDELRANGIDLGHRVRFVRHVIYKMRVDMILGRPEHVLVMQSSDIVGSEDLQVQLLHKNSQVITSEVEGYTQHDLVTPDGKTWHPKKPSRTPDA